MYLVAATVVGAAFHAGLFESEDRGASLVVSEGKPGTVQ
jgi:hypothetical protein